MRLRCIQGWNRLKILLPVRSGRLRNPTGLFRPVGITCPTGEIPVKNNEKTAKFLKTVKKGSKHETAQERMCVCVCVCFIHRKARFPETRQKVPISNLMRVVMTSLFSTFPFGAVTIIDPSNIVFGRHELISSNQIHIC